MTVPAGGAGSALAAQRLARKLRDLRRSAFPEVALTQRQLGEVLGASGRGGEPLSAPSISSWEQGSAVPAQRWLDVYATFFATERSVSGGSYRSLRLSELTAEERATRDSLASELRAMRDEALRADAGVGHVSGPPGGPWLFPDGRPVTIVSSELPEEQLSGATPEHPTLAYGRMYTFASIDALFELYGHIRAANPRTDVTERKEHELVPDDYATHLVVIGGIDWNALAARLQRMIESPVRQVSPEKGDPGKAYFKVDEGGKEQRFAAEVSDDGRLLSDVGYFLRMPNPFNRMRTLTVCNAHYSLGTLGVVRALTDKWYRDRNAAYLEKRFAGSDAYSIVMRMLVLDGDEVVTPDWTVPTTLLHEWPESP